MGTFKWYRLFNKTEFEASGLVSKNAVVEFEGVGLKNILITKGNLVGVTIDDVFLQVGLNDKNPFRLGETAIFLDHEDFVWWGVYIAN